MKTFEIYLKDLTDEAKDRFLRFSETTEDEGNFDYIPVAYVDIEVEGEEEEENGKV